jgi:hypothetical protein
MLVCLAMFVASAGALIGCSAGDGASSGNATTSFICRWSVCVIRPIMSHVVVHLLPTTSAVAMV